MAFNFDKYPITIEFDIDIEAGKNVFDLQDWIIEKRIETKNKDLSFDNIGQVNVGQLRFLHKNLDNGNEKFFAKSIIRIINRKSKIERDKIKLKDYYGPLERQFQSDIFEIIKMESGRRLNIDLNQEIIEFDFIKKSKLKLIMFTLEQKNNFKPCPTCGHIKHN